MLSKLIKRMLDPRQAESIVTIENLGIPNITALAALSENSTFADIIGAPLPEDTGRVTVLVNSGAVHVNYDDDASTDNALIGAGFDFFGPAVELNKINLINAGTTSVSIFVYRVLTNNF